MKFRYGFLFSSFVSLSLIGCSVGGKLSAGVSKLLAPAHITKLTPSVVLITNEKRGENGTGFFVDGEKNVCTVLTTRHVIGMSSPVRLQTSDLKIWITNKIRLFPNHDLAVVTFDAGSEDCPYKALKLGNSENLKIGDNVYIAGFTKETEGGKINNHFVSSRILTNQDITEGYAISYNATTANEMSGSPVFDKIGNVVAVHALPRGKAFYMMLFNNKFLQKPHSAVNRNNEGGVVETPDIEWAIPMKTFLANVNKVSVGDIASVQSAKDWFNIGRNLHWLQLNEDAVAAYDKAIQINSRFAEAWYERGQALFNSQRYEDAVASYDKAIQIKSDFADAWFGRGFALNHLKRYNDAVTSYDKAVKIKPDKAIAWYFRANALYDLKRYKDALASYDKAVQISSRFVDAWFKRGNALYDLKRYEEAIASYDKAIQIKSDIPATAWWFNRGNALNHLKRYEEAVASYDKAIQMHSAKTVQINSDLANAWYNRGLALDDLKRYKDAVASYDKAIQIKSDFANAWYFRGNALSDLKRYKDAVASYDKAIQFKPNDADAWLLRGMALSELKRYEDAVASYDKAIQIKPKNADTWFGRGIVLVLQGRNQEALESVEKGLKINPNVKYGQELRKTILQELGR
ncbi:MAG: serine protease [Microcoleus vaginatus WJT46-NPBG5]|jgi:tetratricopeptide (TPR) repeat protein|nr:serine protease [Microcoleus vaginatus WJT46-NPBG5]